MKGIEVRLNELVEDEGVSLDDMFSIAIDEGLGFIDGVNDREIIEMYISEKMLEGIRVSHILRAIEDSDSYYFEIWLGNSMETPEPIETKERLMEALGY